MSKDDSILWTPRWFQLPGKVLAHETQKSLFRRDLIKRPEVQYKAVAAGRRSFKTERMKRRIIRKLISPTRYDFNNRTFVSNYGERYLIGAPIRKQAKDIFWQDLKDMIPPYIIEGKPRESDLEINIKGINTTLVVAGLEEYERVEGIRWAGVYISEYQKCDGDLFGRTIQPMLNDTGGEGIFEGRPLGKNHFYDEFMREKTAPERWESFHWTSEEILTAEQIQAAKDELGWEDYKREYLASFESGSQVAYYSFSEENYDTKPIEWHRPLILTCDFNAEQCPMSWTLGQRFGRDTYWMKSFSTQFTNTKQQCEKIDDWFKEQGNYPKMIFFYGDYSGTRSTSNSSYSDWEIIMEHFGNKCVVERRIKHMRTYQGVRDRVASTNAQLCNSNNERHMFIDPKGCKPLIKDYLRVEWKKNGYELKEEDPLDGHNAASVDYYNFYEFPIENRPYVTIGQ